jgi:hypothetical protein
VDNKYVSRKKSKYDNSYTISGGMELKALVHSVPDVVTNILNMGSINLQAQMDAPFLLADSPGEVAKILNKIVNLEEIDRALFNASKKIRSIETDYKLDTTRVENVKKELSKYDYLEEMEFAISLVEENQTKLMELIAKIDLARELVSQSDTIYEDLQELNDVLALEPTINELMEKMGMYWKTIEVMDEYAGLLDNIEIFELKKAKVEKYLTMETVVKDLLNKCDEHESLGIVIKDLREALDIFKLNDTVVKRLDKEIKKDEKEFHTRMGKNCPLCGQALMRKWGC